MKVISFELRNQMNHFGKVTNKITRMNFSQSQKLLGSVCPLNLVDANNENNHQQVVMLQDSPVAVQLPSRGCFPKATFIYSIY